MLPEDAVGSSIVIAGPTAIGKTAVALEISRTFPDRFEIVSADSVQVYRRFDIGSAKPTPEERKAASFHLVDFVDPDADFTLVDYQTLALAALANIVSRGKIPLIVGGTGLYIRAIAQGLGVPLAVPNERLRAHLTEKARVEGRKSLHEQLISVDPESAARIHENDLKRIVRALEVFELTGRTLSSWHQEDKERPRNAPRKYIVLNRDRDRLYHLIDLRAAQMFADGIIGEVESLRKEGYPPTLKPMQAVGYLQANLVLKGKVPIEQAIELTQNATHQFARRQLIWFRGEPGTHWIEVEGMGVEEMANKVVDIVGI
jgi:tRNA dimethylallyltransferase